MTLGEHPGKVPPRHLIPEEVFGSDYDIGRFRDVAPALGLDLVGLAGGGIMEDFDGDGHLDVFATSWGLRDQVRYFRNGGDGSFSDLTGAAGLLGIVGGLNALQTDYDNDGWADLLVLRGAWLNRPPATDGGRHPNSLLRNLGGVEFADVTAEAGLLSFHPTQTAAWGDCDNDGWLDLYIGNESLGAERHPNELYLNARDGSFRNVAAAGGVAVEGYVKGVVWGDYDNDGLLDLYVSRLHEEEPNILFRNRAGSSGPLRFDDVTEAAGVPGPAHSFPAWFWDYDNDGWLDLFVSGYRARASEVAADYLGIPHYGELPRLYRNNRDGSFADATREARLDKPLLTMGSNFGDLDNDGWLDCYAGTGSPGLTSLMPNRMFRNAGGRFFQDVTTSGGFGHIQKGHGVAFGDVDHDGDQDVYATMGGGLRRRRVPEHPVREPRARKPLAQAEARRGALQPGGDRGPHQGDGRHRGGGAGDPRHRRQRRQLRGLELPQGDRPRAGDRHPVAGGLLAGQRRAPAVRGGGDGPGAADHRGRSGSQNTALRALPAGSRLKQSVSRESEPRAPGSSLSPVSGFPVSSH